MKKWDENPHRQAIVGFCCWGVAFFIIFLSIVLPGCSSKKEEGERKVPYSEPIAPMPISVIEKVSLDHLKVGERGFIHTQDLQIGWSRIGYIKRDAEVFFAPWVGFENSPFLEIYLGEKGLYVVLHGCHKWTMETKTLYNVRPIVFFHQTDDVDLILPDNWPEDVRVNFLQNRSCYGPKH